MEKEYRLIGHGNKSTKFVLDHDNEYVVDFGKWGAHYRVGFDTDWKVDPIYVDPPGGPFISVGYKTDNVEVTELFYEEEKGFKVKLKEV